MKKRLEVRDWKKASLLFHEDRGRILSFCLTSPHSIKDLSKAMGLNPGSVFHHVKKLHEAGFLEVVQRRMINGIEEKKYSKSAEFIDLSKIEEVDLPKRDEKIGQEIKKKVKKLLGSDPGASIKSQGAKLSEQNYAYVLGELQRLREFVLAHDDVEEEERTILIYAIGKERQ